MNLGNLAIGAVAAALIAGAALRTHSLTRGGALAAFVVGTLTFGYGGPGGAAVLLGFFVSSTLLSRVGRARKRRIAGDIGKTGPRDAWQVLANGGIATVAIVAGGPLGVAAFAGAYAAANADTWGTEIGMLARQEPRSILTGRPLGTGISGGVTIVGSLAEVAGALFIAAFAFAGWPAYPPLAVAATVGGIAGALLDSLLGATLQERRWCPACERECENDPHGCGTATIHRRGFAWVRNDGVNLAATAGGALIAAALVPLLALVME